MTTTAEVRWFFDGPLPDAVWLWFKQHALHPGQLRFSTLKDYYLVFQQSACASVKLREGRLEVKSYVEDSWVEADYPGSYQVWEKWSQYLGMGFTEGKVEGDWLEMRKTRSLRTFAYVAGVLKEMMADNADGEGCQVELVELEAKGRSFYSLSFEATGEPDERRRLLIETVNHVLLTVPEELKTSKKLFFSTRNSCSYPEWLLQVKNGARQVTSN